MRHILTEISPKFKLRIKYVLKRFVKRAPEHDYSYFLFIFAYTRATAKMRRRLGACKTGLPQPSPVFFITDRSKVIRLQWFYLLYVLVLNFCSVCTLCAFSFIS